MEKTSRKNKIIFIILETSLIFIIISSLLLYYKNKKNLEEKTQTYTQLLNQYKEKEKEIINKENELNNITKTTIEYQKIDDEINETKNTFFKLAKELENQVVNKETNLKIAYLTFDDGPYLNTYKVLDILDKYDIKATFFTTSVNGKVFYEETNNYNYELYKEYLKRGHTIANHTYTHGIFKGLYDSVDSFMKAVIDQENHIKEQTGGYITNILRFPGGSGTAKDLKYPIIEALRERGYGWVDWNAYDGDGWNLKSQSEAWNNIYKSVNEDIEVFLFHDYCQITIDILPDIIEYLQNKGYIFLPLFYESKMINK